MLCHVVIFKLNLIYIYLKQQQVARVLLCKHSLAGCKFKERLQFDSVSSECKHQVSGFKLAIIIHFFKFSMLTDSIYMRYIYMR